MNDTDAPTAFILEGDQHVACKKLYETQKASHLLCQLCQGFSPGQIGEPVVDGALRPRCNQREIILLVDLWLTFARVWKRVVSQFLGNDAAEVGADLKRRRCER